MSNSYITQSGCANIIIVPTGTKVVTQKHKKKMQDQVLGPPNKKAKLEEDLQPITIQTSQRITPEHDQTHFQNNVNRNLILCTDNTGQLKDDSTPNILSPINSPELCDSLINSSENFDSETARKKVNQSWAESYMRSIGQTPRPIKLNNNPKEKDKKKDNEFMEKVNQHESVNVQNKNQNQKSYKGDIQGGLEKKITKTATTQNKYKTKDSKHSKDSMPISPKKPQKLKLKENYMKKEDRNAHIQSPSESCGSKKLKDVPYKYTIPKKTKEKITKNLNDHKVKKVKSGPKKDKDRSVTTRSVECKSNKTVDRKKNHTKNYDSISSFKSLIHRIDTNIKQLPSNHNAKDDLRNKLNKRLSCIKKRKEAFKARENFRISVSNNDLTCESAKKKIKSKNNNIKKIQLVINLICDQTKHKILEETIVKEKPIKTSLSTACICNHRNKLKIQGKPVEITEEIKTEKIDNNNTNVDLSFLDDFNIDEIVESLCYDEEKIQEADEQRIKKCPNFVKSGDTSTQQPCKLENGSDFVVISENTALEENEKQVTDFTDIDKKLEILFSETQNISHKASINKANATHEIEMMEKTNSSVNKNDMNNSIVKRFNSKTGIEGSKQNDSNNCEQCFFDTSNLKNQKVDLEQHSFTEDEVGNFSPNNVSNRIAKNENSYLETLDCKLQRNLVKTVSNIDNFAIKMAEINDVYIQDASQAQKLNCKASIQENTIKSNKTSESLIPLLQVKQPVKDNDFAINIEERQNEILPKQQGEPFTCIKKKVYPLALETLDGSHKKGLFENDNIDVKIKLHTTVANSYLRNVCTEDNDNIEKKDVNSEVKREPNNLENMPKIIHFKYDDCTELGINKDFAVPDQQTLPNLNKTVTKIQRNMAISKKMTDNGHRDDIILLDDNHLDDIILKDDDENFQGNGKNCANLPEPIYNNSQNTERKDNRRKEENGIFIQQKAELCLKNTSESNFQEVFIKDDLSELRTQTSTISSAAALKYIKEINNLSEDEAAVKIDDDLCLSKKYLQKTAETATEDNKPSTTIVSHKFLLPCHKTDDNKTGDGNIINTKVRLDNKDNLTEDNIEKKSMPEDKKLPASKSVIKKDIDNSNNYSIIEGNDITIDAKDFKNNSQETSEAIEATKAPYPVHELKKINKDADVKEAHKGDFEMVNISINEKVNESKTLIKTLSKLDSELINKNAIQKPTEKENIKIRGKTMLLLASNLENRMSSFLEKSYRAIEVVHAGSFSIIMRCKDDVGKNYAVKINRIKHNSDYGSKKENMLMTLQDKTNKEKYGCIFLINGFSLNGQWCFLFDYYPKSLKQALEEGLPFHIDIVQKLARQLAEALNMLKRSLIVHADIKPQHILLNENKDCLKLCGFDRAFYVEQVVDALPTLNSPAYRAPEAILGHSADHSIDIWASAMVLYEMATTKRLIDGRFNNHLLYVQQYILGNIPKAMIKLSKFRHLHFNNEFDFVWRYKPEDFFIIKRFKKTCSLNRRVYEHYNSHWNTGLNKITASEKVKCRLFCQLLKNMLTLSPLHRATIENIVEDQFFKQ